MLKFDFGKATVECDCILKMLHSWGFTSTWISWIRLWLTSAKVSVLVNGIQCRQIYYKQGLRQGDPLSPLIFILVANELHHMIARCREEGLIEDLGCQDDTNVVINLYADDTLIFRKDCLSYAMILKCKLFYCEMWSRLKINFHKSSPIFWGIFWSTASYYP